MSFTSMSHIYIEREIYQRTNDTQKPNFTMKALTRIKAKICFKKF